MENRKIQLSKKLLKIALLELLEEKDLHQVSIKSLCEKADLNRSTFYAHYEDIHFLIHEIEDDILQEMPFMNYTKSPTQKEFITFAEFINKNYKTIMILVRNGKLIDRIVDKSVDFYLINEGEKTEKQIEAFITTAHFCLGGMFQALLYWSTHQKNLSVQDISQILYQIFNKI